MTPESMAPLAVHSPFKFNIPPAPPTGLLLSDVNERYELEFFVLSLSELEYLEKFKRDVIYAKIAEDYTQNPSILASFYEVLEMCRLPESELVSLEELGKEYWKELEVAKERQTPRRFVTQVVKTLFGPQIRTRLPRRNYLLPLPENYRIDGPGPDLH